MSELKIRFPEIFKTGVIDNITERQLCADAIMAWGCCMAGSKPPKKFGEVLVAIGQKLGISPQIEILELYAVKKGWLKNDTLNRGGYEYKSNNNDKRR